MQLGFDLFAERCDLRKSPYKGERADHSAYVGHTSVKKSSTALPVGTQQRFIDASVAASRLSFPLNTMLTLRWSSLFSDNSVNALRCMTIPERIDYLVELLRKWLTRNDQPAFYIWVREAAGSSGEHWHIIFHIPAKKRPALAAYVAKLTGEAKARGSRSAGRSTEGEFACGEIASWHLAHDVKPERQKHLLAAYLGKGEPSQRLFRGKLKDNEKKPVRGRSYGGSQADGKYDSDQGYIIGTECRGDRFFISKALQRAARGSR